MKVREMNMKMNYQRVASYMAFTGSRKRWKEVEEWLFILWNLLQLSELNFKG
jgi:hypothetical protein